MRRAAIVLVAAAAVAGGCGGRHASSPVTRISATDLGSPATSVLALPRAKPDGKEVPLASVRSLVPLPLPPAGGACTGTGTVTITFENGQRVRYGACRPRSITLLQQVLTSEARQWAAPPVTSTRIVGAGPVETRALRSLLHALGRTRISSIGIEPVKQPSRWNLTPGDVRLRVHAGQSVRGEWEAALLAGLYTAEAGSRGLRPVGLVAGSDTTRARGFTGRPFSLAHARRRVAAALAGDGRIVELRAEALGLAVVVRTPQPARFLEDHGRALAAAADVPAHYVAVEDAAGAIVYAWAGLPYEGIVYPRPDLDACGPIAHSSPPLAQPGPCPAR